MSRCYSSRRGIMFIGAIDMIIWVLLAIVAVFFTGYFFLEIPLLPLLFIAAVTGCIVAFVVFGIIGKETEEKVNRLVKKEKKFKV